MCQAVHINTRSHHTGTMWSVLLCYFTCGETKLRAATVSGTFAISTIARIQASVRLAWTPEQFPQGTSRNLTRHPSPWRSLALAGFVSPSSNPTAPARTPNSIKLLLLWADPVLRCPGCHNKMPLAAWITQQKYSSVLEAGKYTEVRVQEGLTSGEPLLGLQTAAFLLCLHMVSPCDK